MKQLFDRFAPLVVIAIFLLLVLSIIRISIFEAVDPEKHIYFEIVFLLLLAIVGELAVIYLKQPSVMILMILGIIMSPSFLNLGWEFFRSLNLPFILSSKPPEILKAQAVINVFAQLGAIILLFKVGLHNKLEGVFRFDNLAVAVAGVIFPFLVGYYYATLTGGTFAYSMFVAAALTATSVGVTVALLKEFNLIQERFARIIIGAAILDDVLGLLVLSFVINVIGGEASLQSLIFTFVSAVIFLLGSVVAGNYFINYLDQKEMSPRRFLLVLAFMLFYAYLAEFIKLSAIVGAFIAGVMLNRSRHINEIEEKTYGLELLFMPIFFITLGILVDVRTLLDFTLPIIILSILATLTKIIPCTFASLWAKIKPREALMIGVGMAPRGEVALIVASLGLTTNVLTAAQYSVISAMALMTTFVVPPLLGLLISLKHVSPKPS